MKTKILKLRKFIFYFLLVLSIASCTKVADPPSGNNNTGGNNSGGNSNNNGNDNDNEPPTVTAPETQFISFQNYTVYDYGAYKLEPFTINTTTKFVMRFTSKYTSQAAIITPDQVSNFQNMAAFSGYSLFDKKIGTQYVTLAPGSYYVGVRNTSSAENEYSVELDLNIELPASDKCVYFDNYFQGVKSYSNGGGWITQGFTVQNGYRYFLDGCNIGFDTYIIPGGEATAFQTGQRFNYFTDYYITGGNGPGLYEIKLPPGNYAFAARSHAISSITYTMERWKVN